jgi:hypothetical protein
VISAPVHALVVWQDSEVMVLVPETNLATSQLEKVVALHELLDLEGVSLSLADLVGSSGSVSSGSLGS